MLIQQLARLARVAVSWHLSLIRSQLFPSTLVSEPHRYQKRKGWSWRTSPNCTSMTFIPPTVLRGTIPTCSSLKYTSSYLGSCSDGSLPHGVEQSIAA